MSEVNAIKLLNKRKYIRYKFEEQIKIMKNNELYDTGKLIDISVGGASFRTSVGLTVGDRYILSSKTFGDLPCVAVRCFGIANVGVEFDFEHYTATRMARKLAELPGAVALSEDF